MGVLDLAPRHAKHDLATTIAPVGCWLRPQTKVVHGSQDCLQVLVGVVHTQLNRFYLRFYPHMISPLLFWVRGTTRGGPGDEARAGLNVVALGLLISVTKKSKLVFLECQT